MCSDVICNLYYVLYLVSLAPMRGSSPENKIVTYVFTFLFSIPISFYKESFNYTLGGDRTHDNKQLKLNKK